VESTVPKGRAKRRNSKHKDRMHRRRQQKTRTRQIAHESLSFQALQSERWNYAGNAINWHCHREQTSQKQNQRAVEVMQSGTWFHP
jgi:hypothetical protein